MWREVYPEFKGKVIKGLYQWSADEKNEYFLLTCEPEMNTETEGIIPQLMLTVPKVKIKSCANCKYGIFPMSDICKECRFENENSNEPIKWEEK
jgi:hypothetical protein